MSDRNVGRIDPASLKTEDLLAGLLVVSGFTSRPVRREANGKIMREKAYAGQPQRTLLAQDQQELGMAVHVVIAVEAGRLCLYRYEAQNDLFRPWGQLEGPLEVEQIRQTIRAAMRPAEGTSGAGLARRDWTTFLVLAAGLEVILVFAVGGIFGTLLACLLVVGASLALGTRYVVARRRSGPASWTGLRRSGDPQRPSADADAQELPTDFLSLDSPEQTREILRNFAFLVEDCGCVYSGLHGNHYDYLTERAQLRVERENSLVHVSVLRAGEPEFARLSLELILRYFGQGELLGAGNRADMQFEDNLRFAAGALQGCGPRIVAEIDTWWLGAVKFQYDLTREYYRARNQLDTFQASSGREREYLRRKGVIG